MRPSCWFRRRRGGWYWPFAAGPEQRFGRQCMCGILLTCPCSLRLQASVWPARGNLCAFNSQPWTVRDSNPAAASQQRHHIETWADSRPLAALNGHPVAEYELKMSVHRSTAAVTRWTATAHVRGNCTIVYTHTYIDLSRSRSHRLNQCMYITKSVCVEVCVGCCSDEPCRSSAETTLRKWHWLLFTSPALRRPPARLNSHHTLLIYSWGAVLLPEYAPLAFRGRYVGYQNTLGVSSSDL